jgi:drug/metabolite transporter (DMT)-like permease
VTRPPITGASARAPEARLAAGAPAEARPLRAFVWMWGAIASFSLMAVAGREAQAVLHSFELMAWRSGIGLIIVAGVVAWSARGFAQVRTQRPGLHLQRNLLHFMGQNAWFYGLTMIPLAQLFALEFTSPIWVALLASVFLGEALTRRRLVAVGLGFVGLLIVARPGLEPLNIGHAAAMLAALGFACNTIWTKRIMAHDSVLCVLFWMTALQMVFGLLMSAPLGMTWPPAQIWPWVVLTSITGLTAHYSLTSALRLAPAGIVAPMEFLRLPMIAVVGAVFYGEALVIWVLVGALVILAGNLINLTAPRPGRG